MPIAPMLAVLVALQTSGPSFDCDAATTPIEHAICANPEWSRLDRRMAERYRAALQNLSGPAREALRRDQRWFLAARDEWFENRGRWDGFGDVPQRLTARAAFLDSIRPGAPETLVGRWRNLAGEVEIQSSGPGRLWITVYGANPVNARWLCEGVSFGGGLEGRSVEGVASEDPAYRVRVSLRDGYLEVEEEPMAPNTDAPAYCGANGYVSGTYFRVE